VASCPLSPRTSSIASDHLRTDALRRTSVRVATIRVAHDTRGYRSPHAPAFVQDVEKAIITQRGFLYTERAFLLFPTRFLTVDPALGPPSHVLPYVISLTYENEIMVAKGTSDNALLPNVMTPQGNVCRAIVLLVSCLLLASTIWRRYFS